MPLPILGSSGCLPVAAAPAGAADVEVTGIRRSIATGRPSSPGRTPRRARRARSTATASTAPTEPITAENLAQAELCYRGVLNNSAKLYGSAFNLKDRLDPQAVRRHRGGRQAAAAVERAGGPHGPEAGQGVLRRRRHRREVEPRSSKVVPGKSATTEAVDEKPGPDPADQAVRLEGAQGAVRRQHQHHRQEGPAAARHPARQPVERRRGRRVRRLLPLLRHPRDGLPRRPARRLLRRGAPPQGRQPPAPAGARRRRAPRAARGRWRRTGSATPACRRGRSTPSRAFYPFTENRLLWMTSTGSSKRYGADPERVTVGGSSSGAVGSMNVGFRHPELFAAAYPSVGRVRRVPAIALEGKLDREGARPAWPTARPPTTTAWTGPKFAAEHRGDLPFLGWACGRHDGYATWQEHIDMVKAMTAAPPRLRLRLEQRRPRRRRQGHGG